MKIGRRLVRAALLFLPLSLLSVPNAAAQEVVVRASGQGFFFTAFGGALRVFAFTAVQREDGTVMGQVVLFSQASGARIHIEVTCIRVVDSNTVVVGGVVTQSTSPGLVGRQVVFAVSDGGEGIGSVDFVSPLFEGTCESNRPLESLLPIDAGNVQVDTA
ncbi:hypothetical protein [Sorangium sp. So ce887]|uniref:hypothetical protein n=1 Tax=Sorangium sp. So ce887 TaxID=3133324 RepID=UPI003F608CFE